MKNIEIRELSFGDYEAARSLWNRCQGIGLSDADEPEPMRRFLECNPGLNLAAWSANELIATLLCGTDGRRGYLYHLAVDPRFRRQGVGRELVQRVFYQLHTKGIQKCHIMVYATNQDGLAFWKSTGWVTRPEIVLMSSQVRTGYPD